MEMRMAIQCGRLIAGILILLFVSSSSVGTCGQSRSDEDRTIIIRMLDSKTGKQIPTYSFMVYFGESLKSAKWGRPPDLWVHPDKDGTGQVTLPRSAAVLSVQAPDGPDGWAYMKCDTVTNFGHYREHWYSVATIVASGLVAPNHCSRQGALAKPGEFVFFVRTMTDKEKAKS
jgi:hypothetical protein